MSIINVTADKIKDKIISKAVGDGDYISIFAFGPDAFNWQGSTSECGKTQSMMTMLGGIADAITGSQSPTGDFSSVISNSYIAGSDVGIDGSLTCITSLSDSIGIGTVGLKYKTKTITFSKGLLTGVSPDSSWNYI